MVKYSFVKPNPLNLENLDIELDASPVVGYVGVVVSNSDPSELDVLFESASNLDQVNIDAVQAMLDAHDGKQARTTLALQQKREQLFSKLVDKAHHHPVLKAEDVVNNPPHTGENVISKYLASIDNKINSWKRDGNHHTIVNKLVEDANDGGGEFHGFLNTKVADVTNPADPEGAKLEVLTFQYIISEIPETPYI